VKKKKKEKSWLIVWERGQMRLCYPI